jgi:hypothetical protein
MSKEEFSKDEFQQRHVKLRTAMAEVQIDLLLITSVTCLQFLYHLLN